MNHEHERIEQDDDRAVNDRNEPEDVAAATTATGARTVLAELPAGSLLDKMSLARAFGVSAKTVSRMCQRGELPRPIRLAGRAQWLSDSVLSHLRDLAEQAERERQRELARLRPVR